MKSLMGILLQIMYMGNVTPGGAVAWDLSYATYIGAAGARLFSAGREYVGNGIRTVYSSCCGRAL